MIVASRQTKPSQSYLRLKQSLFIYRDVPQASHCLVSGLNSASVSLCTWACSRLTEDSVRAKVSAEKMEPDFLRHSR